MIATHTPHTQRFWPIIMRMPDPIWAAEGFMHRLQVRTIRNPGPGTASIEMGLWRRSDFIDMVVLQELVGFDV
jgi:hypothetical protein